MRSQRQDLLLLVLAAACTGACGRADSAVSTRRSGSAAADAPDLGLRGVAFVRTSEGRVSARGTAARLDYRRAGGHVDAQAGVLTVFPEPGAKLATFGAMTFAAPHATGEVTARRGVAEGGVRFAAAHGDRGETESVEYEGDLIHGERPVLLSGPGYQVRGHGIVARTDGNELRLGNGVTGTLQAGAP